MCRPSACCALLVIFLGGCDRSLSSTAVRTDDAAHSTSLETPLLHDVKEQAASSLLSDLEISRLESNMRSATGIPQATCARFRDMAGEMRIDFRYENGDSPAKLMTQATGGGVGWFDYDCDSFPDLLWIQGGNPLPSDRAHNPWDRLLRNLSGTRFVDITSLSRIEESGFGQGVALADFDNDGFVDVYVTNVGLDSFYRNLGDGTFLDQSEPAHLINPLWGSSAAWGDLDSDGDLDLYVCNYVDYDPENPITCYGKDRLPGICHPDEVEPAPNVLFVNRGDGTFEGILESAGLDQPGSKSLGVVIADLNGDQVVDIYVANDTRANHLFINEGMLHFKEMGVLAGCATNAEGLYQASMGVGFGDFNEDGNPDLFCTHFTSDYDTLYQGLGDGMFADVTKNVGLFTPSLSTLGFGTVMADFDCNGRDEIFIANGHIDDSFQATGDRFKMPAQLFAWTGSTWVDLSLDAGPYFQREVLGRGVASADFDRDGDLDLAVSHQLDSASVLRNDCTGRHWLKLRFVGTDSNRNGLGVLVRVMQGDKLLHGQLVGGTSYCSSHEPIVCFGFGDSDTNVSVDVTWPSRRTTHVESIAVDQELIVREGG